jgi:hypothetical protein
MEFDTLSKILFFPIIVIVAIIFMNIGMSRRIRGKSSISAADAESKIPSLQETLNVRDQLNKLMVNLQELSRDISGQIDTRSCKLEVLLKEADQTIKRLESFGQSHSSNSVSPTQPIDPEKELIYKLADSGKTSVEIAKETKKNTGEIELILSLRNTSQKNSRSIDYRIG